MNHRDYYRQVFSETWQKYRASQALTAFEKPLLEVILQHPEYHPELEKPDLLSHFAMDENPYLHLGLHMGLLEQLSTERPAGINHAYERLLAIIQDVHETQHHMMKVMAELLWAAQNKGALASEAEYLEKLHNSL